MKKEYFFQGGQEVAKVEVDYKDRTIKIAARLTGFQYKALHVILSNKKAMILYGHIKDMDNETFEKYLKYEFKKMGYKFITEK